ncbi:fluoride efflux transporter CrcB [Mesonia sediminis]|uniref:Fluoride-specific ion channel FluC n=1 Tax=Mesonia sediminis TaxID=1703946 RepID=A0ABW5SG87_9FLAO
MKAFLLVFLGGGLGSALRYLIQRLYNTSTWPLGTMLVNILGCLIIGFVAGYLIKTEKYSISLNLLVISGFCGGFTTFSSFGLEGVKMLQAQAYWQFLGYTLLSLCLGYLAVGVGLFIMKVSY